MLSGHTHLTETKEMGFVKCVAPAPLFFCYGTWSRTW
jgi:hypothetical protein